MRTRTQLLPLAVALLASSCAHRQSAAMDNTDTCTRVIAGYIFDADSEELEHIFALIDTSGIHAALDGSRGYDVWVPSKDRLPAIEMFKQDAATNGYKFVIKQ